MISLRCPAVLDGLSGALCALILYGFIFHCIPGASALASSDTVRYILPQPVNSDTTKGCGMGKDVGNLLPEGEKMKRLFVLACAVVFAFVFIGAAAADTKITFKKGDEVYVCGCEGCPCLTMSKKPGKCGCGKDLVKTTIDKVKRGKAYVMVDGKTKVFKTKGKYACACGADCNCSTISQKPGDCSCGKPMKAVKSGK